MKFSIIGTNWITEMFIKAAKETQLAKLNAVYSRTESKAKEFAEKHGAEHWYTQMDDLLSDESDFVYIASPNSLHYEQALACVNHGKHVFCEKPMGYTEQQIVKIHDAASKHGVYVFEGYRHLFSPNYAHLKNNLTTVGKVRTVLLQYIQYSSRYDAYQEGQIANVFSKDFAGGVLMDLGVYPLSMAIDLFGEPEAIEYFPVKLSNGIDGSGTLVLSYSEHQVTIMVSKMADATLPSEIHGEEGTLTIDHIAPISKLTFTDRKTKEVKELAGEQLELDMVYELEKFKQMIDQDDKQSYEKWMERSRQVAKWTKIARHKARIYFPGE